MIRPTALLAFALSALGCVSTSGSGQLRHVVLFQFNSGTTSEQIRAIEDSFRGLPARIPEIADFEWGTDVSVEELADGFTHCFVVSFRDREARAAYLPHPAHQEFVALAGPSIERVLVVDYVAGR